MLDRLRKDEEGFTLIELLVVILIIGILAAIALPTFLGQSKKGQDASAKSDVRNAVSQMESCYTNAGNYDLCPDAESPLASGVTVTGKSPTTLSQGYTVTKASDSGTSFSISKDPTTGSYSRACSAVGGGCKSVTAGTNGW